MVIFLLHSTYYLGPSHLSCPSLCFGHLQHRFFFYCFIPSWLETISLEGKNVTLYVKKTIIFSLRGISCTEWQRAAKPTLIAVCFVSPEKEIENHQLIKKYNKYSMLSNNFLTWINERVPYAAFEESPFTCAVFGIISFFCCFTVLST